MGCGEHKLQMYGIHQFFFFKISEEKNIKFIVLVVVVFRFKFYIPTAYTLFSYNSRYVLFNKIQIRLSTRLIPKMVAIVR